MELFHTSLSSIPVTSTPLQENSDVANPPAISPVLVKKEEEKENIHTGLPANLPFPDRFSMKVEMAINAGNILPQRKQLIATFYYSICSNPLQGDYKCIAIKMCEKFPELKDSTGPRYWVCDLFFSSLFS